MLRCINPPFGGLFTSFGKVAYVFLTRLPVSQPGIATPLFPLCLPVFVLSLRAIRLYSFYLSNMRSKERALREGGSGTLRGIGWGKSSEAAAEN